MKISVSLPHEDLELLDAFVRDHGLTSRSAALHAAVQALRLRELGDAYGPAWDEWSSTGEADVWESALGDGL
jgi:Arc/MetJ-type ribon-helix-helix transcriptional regulator